MTVIEAAYKRFTKIGGWNLCFFTAFVCLLGTNLWLFCWEWAICFLMSATLFSYCIFREVWKNNVI